MLSAAAPYLAAVSLAGGVIAAEGVNPDPGAGFAPYIGGGATMILATALAEVMRRMLNGRLISRETREVEMEQGAAILAGAQREDQYMKLAIENRERADAAELRAQKVAAELAVVTKAHTAQVTEALHDMTQALRDLREDLRRDRGN